MNEYSNWIWCKDWSEENNAEPTMVLFRKNIEIENVLEKAVIQISADSRYKLYINEQFVEVGPSKGDNQIWFLDEIDISSYLVKGENVIAVMVLRNSMKPGSANQSIVCTSIPGLYLEAQVIDCMGNTYDLSANDTWKCKISKEIKIIPEAEGFAPLFIFEKVQEQKDSWNWKEITYDDSNWGNAVSYHKSQIRDAISPGNLQPRTIPFMYKQKRYFCGVKDIIKSTSDVSNWNQMLKGDCCVRIPANTQEIVELDAGEEMTGYYKLLLEGGSNCKITILQSEAYVQNNQVAEGNIPVKKDRLDHINGHLEGYSDYYYPSGEGSTTHLEVYEPFWFRTFRFIQLKIETSEHPLTIHGFHYMETGYPLKVETKVITSDKTLLDIWELSERTLKRCMHESYEDCPFYEQLQYVMDSRAQILYTYACAADDRLARKCIDDFKRAQRYDGLISSAYPNTKPNVIPGFSMYYILMLHDHMMYFGDQKLIRYHMPTVENILYFFEKNKAEQGYVGKIGGYHRQAKFWSFIDWTRDWKIGVPNAISQGPLTMESLLYIMGLQKAAQLAEYIGRAELANQYRQEAKSVQESILKYCIGENGMVQDGPGVKEYSQHCQIFAILTDTVDFETGNRNLRQTIERPEQFTQCSVAMTLYLFRAMERSGLYDYIDQYWNIWRDMLKNNMTTCAESDSYSRSDCHAWGAVALYELPAVTLGVKPQSPGFETVSIHPIAGHLNAASGTVVTPKGIIEVSWTKKDEEIILEYTVPDGMKVVNQRNEP